MKSPLDIKLDDDTLERVRLDLRDRVMELQRLVSAQMRVIQNVTLEDGVATPVPHGLGRRPVWFAHSPPRGPSTSGRIEEVRDGSVDSSRHILITANGYGATVTIDLVVL